jgi:tetratricopeptide (TPR) repeat protein
MAQRSCIAQLLGVAAATLVACSAPAQDNREALGQAAENAGQFAAALNHYTAAIQATATRSEAEIRLLERAATVAAKVKPVPPLPADAERHFVRGQALVESAKDSDAFMRAADEFRAAVRIAPWLADGYYNAAIVLDKAQRYADAIRYLKLYMLAAPSAKDTAEAQRLIYRIEVRQEDALRARSNQAAAQPAITETTKAHPFQRYVGELRVGEPSNYSIFRGTLTEDRLELVETGYYNASFGGYTPVTWQSRYVLSSSGSAIAGTYFQRGKWTFPVSGSIGPDGNLRLVHKGKFISPNGNALAEQDWNREFRPTP